MVTQQQYWAMMARKREIERKYESGGRGCVISMAEISEHSRLARVIYAADQTQPTLYNCCIVPR